MNESKKTHWEWANMGDKLLSLTSLQLVFIVLRVFGVIEWHWLAVTSPIIAQVAMVLGLFIVIGFCQTMIALDENRKLKRLEDELKSLKRDLNGSKVRITP
jgi:hypothetical protein